MVRGQAMFGLFWKYIAAVQIINQSINQWMNEWKKWLFSGMIRTSLKYKYLRTRNSLIDWLIIWTAAIYFQNRPNIAWPLTIQNYIPFYSEFQAEFKYSICLVMWPTTTVGKCLIIDNSFVIILAWPISLTNWFL
jgi:hypothetical protein